MICDQNIFQLIPITWNQPSLNEIVIFMFSKFTFTFNLRTWIERDNILLHYNVTNGQKFFLQKLWQSVRERLSQIWSVTMWLIQLQSILDQIFEPDCNNGWDLYDGYAKKFVFPESCSWRVRFALAEMKNVKYLTRTTR